jgi:hypothetical protein
MSIQERNTQSEQTFDEWIAELQEISHRSFCGVVSSRSTKPGARAVLSSRRRSFRYSLVRSTSRLTSALCALRCEIIRGSFPGINGGVAK